MHTSQLVHNTPQETFRLMVYLVYIRKSLYVHFLYIFPLGDQAFLFKIQRIQ